MYVKSCHDKELDCYDAVIEDDFCGCLLLLNDKRFLSIARTSIFLFIFVVDGSCMENY